MEVQNNVQELNQAVCDGVCVVILSVAELIAYCPTLIWISVVRQPATVQRRG